MLKFLIIGSGGFAGAILRYVLSGLTYRLVSPKPDFPLGTLVVNILGCAFIGFLATLSETRQLFTPETRLLLFVGLLGSFTTFSTFALETFNLIRGGQLWLAFANVSTHLFVAFIAIWLGSALARLLYGG